MCVHHELYRIKDLNRQHQNKHDFKASNTNMAWSWVEMKKVLVLVFPKRANKSMSGFFFFYHPQMFSSAKQSEPCAYRGLNFPISTNHPPINQSWAFSSRELNCISKRTIRSVCIRVVVQIMRTAVFTVSCLSSYLKYLSLPEEYRYPVGAHLQPLFQFKSIASQHVSPLPILYQLETLQMLSHLNLKGDLWLFVFLSPFHHHTSSPCHTFA